MPTSLARRVKVHDDIELHASPPRISSMRTHKIAAFLKLASRRLDLPASVQAFSAAVLFLLPFLFTVALTAFAQTPAAAPQPNFSGKWAGHFDITTPDGVQNDTAVLILKQDGAVITGSAGANEGQQSEIKSGKADGAGIQFAIDVHGSPVIFRLHLDADHLKGDASGDKLTAKIDVTRAGAPVAQSASPAPALFAEIAHMDSVLFDAYNQRDLEKLKTLFTPDLEFYHDRGGLTRYQENMDSFKKTFDGPAVMRRELAEGTLEVYPLKGFGAVEIGIHRFYTTDPGQKERLTATAKFLHVWQQKDGEWKLARVISYDHH
jgi:ketosteroid isomerase-like protein